MTAKYFLDANILVYAHDSADPQKQMVAQVLIKEGLQNDLLILSPQVLSEFFVVITRKVKVPLSPLRARDELENLKLATIVDIDSNLVLAAVDLSIKHRISYWDGLIVAAAEQAGCETLYSEDLSDGQAMGRLKVRNPFLDNDLATSLLTASVK